MTTTTVTMSFYLSQEMVLLTMLAVYLASATAFLIFGPKDPQ